MKANTAFPSLSRVAVAVSPWNVPWFVVQVTPPRQRLKSSGEVISTVASA